MMKLPRGNHEATEGHRRRKAEIFADLIAEREGEVTQEVIDAINTAPNRFWVSIAKEASKRQGRNVEPPSEASIQATRAKLVADYLPASQYQVPDDDPFADLPGSDETDRYHETVRRLHDEKRNLA